MGGKRWTKEEDEIIKSKYPIKGNKIVEDMPDRTIYAIYKRVSFLGVESNVKHVQNFRSNAWTEKEDEIIRLKYQEKGNKICEDLPNRTLPSIHARACALGVTKNNFWTDREDKILEEFYPTMGANVIKKLPNRTIGGISSRAIALGIKYIPISRR